MLPNGLHSIYLDDPIEAPERNVKKANVSRFQPGPTLPVNWVIEQ